ncbi:MAG: hypothetical protein Q7V57_17840 [Actinomycetota bacterium]|nr:hypothetical protein [Actinomycetota bacterium]
MSLDPPQILLEQSFLVALTDAAHARHSDAATLYLTLVDQFERDELLLVAVSDHVQPWAVGRRKGVLAPLDVLHVGHQHRRAADRSPEPDFAVALTLTMCERHKVRRMATFDDRFRTYDLVIFPE